MTAPTDTTDCREKFEALYAHLSMTVRGIAWEVWQAAYAAGQADSPKAAKWDAIEPMLRKLVRARGKCCVNPKYWVHSGIDDYGYLIFLGSQTDIDFIALAANLTTRIAAIMEEQPINALAMMRDSGMDPS